MDSSMRLELTICYYGRLPPLFIPLLSHTSAVRLLAIRKVGSWEILAHVLLVEVSLDNA